MGSGKKTVHGIIGLDIGGSKIDGILWQRGRVMKSVTVPTPGTEKGFFSALFQIVGWLGGDLKAIGVGLAGSVDWRSGKVLRTTYKLKFLRGLKLQKILKTKFHVPVRIDNDTQCFLLAESRLGQARGKKHVVGLTLGTGVGGAVLADGRLLRGVHGAAGHLGHIMIPGGEFERLVASYGFRRLGYRDPKLAPRAVYKQVGKHLGIALANFNNIFDPELFILGGGISRSHAKFLTAALRERRRYALRVFGGRLPPVRISRLKHAGALGAALLFS